MKHRINFGDYVRGVGPYGMDDEGIVVVVSGTTVTVRTAAGEVRVPAETLEVLRSNPRRPRD